MIQAINKSEIRVLQVWELGKIGQTGQSVLGNNTHHPIAARGDNITPHYHVRMINKHGRYT